MCMGCQEWRRGTQNRLVGSRTVPIQHRMQQLGRCRALHRHDTLHTCSKHLLRAFFAEFPAQASGAAAGLQVGRFGSGLDRQKARNAYFCRGHTHGARQGRGRSRGATDGADAKFRAPWGAKHGVGDSSGSAKCRSAGRTSVREQRVVSAMKIFSSFCLHVVGLHVRVRTDMILVSTAHSWPLMTLLLGHRSSQYPRRSLPPLRLQAERPAGTARMLCGSIAS